MKRAADILCTDIFKLCVKSSFKFFLNTTRCLYFVTQHCGRWWWRQNSHLWVTQIFRELQRQHEHKWINLWLFSLRCGAESSMEAQKLQSSWTRQQPLSELHSLLPKSYFIIFEAFNPNSPPTFHNLVTCPPHRQLTQ